MKKHLLSNQRGETIMEVLICTAIIGLIMTGAFALSNRNQAYARSAQERSIANSIGQSQLEKLRSYADDFKISTITSPGLDVFCIKNTDAKTDIKDAIAFAAPQKAVQSDTDLTKYPGECKDLDSPGQYRYAIWPQAADTARIKPPNATDTVGRYMITVRWDSPTGDGVDELALFYEVYDDESSLLAASATVGTDPGGGDPGPMNEPFTWTVDRPGDILKPLSVACEAAELPELGDGGDGCKSTTAGALYGRRAYKATYNAGGTAGVKPGPAKLKITYGEWWSRGSDAPLSNRTPAGIAGNPYTYSVDVAGALQPTTLKLAYVGIEGFKQIKEFDVTINSDLTNPNVSFTWTNNIGNDPDLEIYKIEISRP